MTQSDLPGDQSSVEGESQGQVDEVEQQPIVLGHAPAEERLNERQLAEIRWRVRTQYHAIRLTGFSLTRDGYESEFIADGPVDAQQAVADATLLLDEVEREHAVRRLFDRAQELAEVGRMRDRRAARLKLWALARAVAKSRTIYYASNEGTFCVLCNGYVPGNVNVPEYDIAHYPHTTDCLVTQARALLTGSATADEQATQGEGYIPPPELLTSAIAERPHVTLEGGDADDSGDAVSIADLRASTEQLIAAIQRLPTPLDSQMVAMGVLKLALEQLAQADAAKRGEDSES